MGAAMSKLHPLVGDGATYLILEMERTETDKRRISSIYRDPIRSNKIHS